MSERGIVDWAGGLARPSVRQAKLLNGLGLSPKLSTYTFCNLELHGVPAYSHCNDADAILGTSACIELLTEV